MASTEGLMDNGQYGRTDGQWPVRLYLRELHCANFVLWGAKYGERPLVGCMLVFLLEAYCGVHP